MKLDDLIGIAGAVVVLAGLAFVVQPALAASLNMPEWGLVVIGLLAALEGVRSLRRRSENPIDGAAPDDPEERVSTSVPGDDFDRLLARVARLPGQRWRGGEYDQVRNRLRSGAVDAIVAESGIDREEASRRVATGEWTDDRIAAWFLAEEDVDPPSIRTRIRTTLGGWSRFEFYAIRTAEAVSSYGEERA